MHAMVLDFLVVNSTFPPTRKFPMTEFSQSATSVTTSMSFNTKIEAWAFYRWKGALYAFMFVFHVLFLFKYSLVITYIRIRGVYFR